MKSSESQDSLESSEDIFRKNWSSIVIAAIMDRAKSPPDSADNVTVTKTVFDDLLSVAQVASRVQIGQANDMTITYQNDKYQVVVRHAYIPTFTVSKPTLLEAISEAQRQTGAEIQKWLR
jgi:hypothetical protein